MVGGPCPPAKRGDCNTAPALVPESRHGRPGLVLRDRPGCACYSPPPMNTPIQEVVADPRGRAASSWDAFVGAHPRGHFLQSWNWGTLRAAQGWRVRRFALPSDSGNDPRAVAQVLERRMAGGVVAYVPRGPVCDPHDVAWPQLIEGLRTILGRKAVVLRVEPHWRDTPAHRAALTNVGLRPGPAVQPPSTLRLDLTGEPDTIQAQMKAKWRYNIRLAARKDVIVREVGATMLPTFERLTAQTATRQGIAARAAGYHSAVHAALGDAGHLYAAEHEGRILAMIYVVHFGHTATYLYGASSEEERSRMPNHALQWAAMQAARAAGLREYDFWGVPDAVGRAAAAGDDPDAVPAAEEGLWGVWRFKRGFGGEVWRAVGAYDDVYAPLRYALGLRLRALRQR